MSTTVTRNEKRETKAKRGLLDLVSRFSFLVSLLSCSAVYAISDNAGTSNGAFLKIPTDARGVALGPAIVSMAEGSEGMRWNPAALGTTDAKEFSSTYIAYYQNVAIENETFAYPLENSALAANLFYLSPGTLDGRDNAGNPTGNFSFYDLVGSLGYGARLPTSDQGIPVYLGGVLKVVEEQIAETSNQNAALDFGVLALPLDDLRAGLTIQNLSTKTANFPKVITGGASYTFFKVFTGGVAASYADDAPMRYSVAGEWRFPELEGAVIRAGYENHDPLDNSTDSKIPALRGASVAGLTMGAGFEYRVPMMKTLVFGVDYAMAPFGALGISHTISVKAKW